MKLLKNFGLILETNFSGEWSNSDVETIVNQANRLEVPPPTSDAHTINGRPGSLFPCSQKDTFTMEVESGKTYLLRIINVALNDQLFFTISGHTMTMVEIDAVYTKPFTTRAVLIALHQAFHGCTSSVDNKTVTAFLQYKGMPNTVLASSLPTFPAPNNTKFALNYNSKIQSLNSPQYPVKVPLKVDHRLVYTIGLGANPCATCQNETRLTASLNNIAFVMTKMGLLQAHYFNILGVFRIDFPDRPPVPFNYTDAPLTANLATSSGTKLRFNSTVELVLQDTNLLTVESHPFSSSWFQFLCRRKWDRKLQFGQRSS
ncbi:hypothetical protein SLEP1_g17618 [Rubroshorea leprosula]|uniref:laccase n=1 Tax=Rubroshorea leprosula TaxID=152421 RepID=A0AAV5IUW5_9ROSI|nr:hypothetical protein SLEP1_g17618 [Rubroshorea leprosula]